MSRVVQTYYARGLGLVAYVEGAFARATQLTQAGNAPGSPRVWRVVRSALFEAHTGLVLDGMDVALHGVPDDDIVAVRSRLDEGAERPFKDVVRTQSRLPKGAERPLRAGSKPVGSQFDPGDAAPHLTLEREAVLR